MNGYIPRQPKQLKERLEAKLDARIIRKLERYCEYLDSDRDYIIGQALDIAFRKDKGFGEWLSRQPAPSVAESSGSGDPLARRRGRKGLRPAALPKSSSGAGTASGAAPLGSPMVSKEA